MKFNRKAYSVGFIGLLLANSIFVSLILYISFSREPLFQEISTIIKFLIYVPPLLVNATWFICVCTLFDNGKKPIEKLKIIDDELSAAIATPSGASADGLVNNFRFKYHRIRHFMILGSFAALMISSSGFAGSASMFKTVEIGDERRYSEHVGFNNKWVKSTKTGNLLAISKNLQNYLANDNNVNRLKSNAGEVGKWHSIFTSNLDCFKVENQLYNQLNDGTLNLRSKYGYMIPNAKLTLTDEYEYWIDPSDFKNCKIRYHKYKYYELSSRQVSNTSHCIYDASSRRFIVDNDDNAMIFMKFKYLTYDSKTRLTHIEYEGSFINLLAQNKTFFFIIWFALGILVSFLVIIFLRKLAKSKKLQEYSAQQSTYFNTSYV